MKRYALVLPSVFVMIFMAAAPLCASVVSEQGVGEQRVLVIMAKFPDVQPSFSRSNMKNKYFDKLDRYLKAVSYQKALRVKSRLDNHIKGTSLAHRGKGFLVC